VDHRKRIRASELLFNPENSNLGFNLEELPHSSYPEFKGGMRGGIAKLAFESIKQCDSDLKVSLYSNIVLAGGSTMMNGFHERFDYEIRKLVRESGDDQKSEFHISAMLHRKYAAWVGGSMISSFSTFKEMAVENTEYTQQAEIDRKNLILKKTIY
jgi:centractin